MTINQKEETNTFFNVAKVFAILSVILAHSKLSNNSILSSLASCFGCIGVTTFYFISGYFFNITKYGTKVFFFKKIFSIVIPWFFWGTIIFFISAQAKTLSNWFNWIIGNGSYLYYLTILFFCYFVFTISEKKYFVISFIFLNIVSLFITSYYLGEKSNIHINNYLNPFNWIGFFALGVVMKDKFYIYLSYIRKFKFQIIFIYALFLIVALTFGNEFGYFSKSAMFNETLGMLALFSLSTFSFFKKSKLILISKYTFTLYLIHFLSFPLRKFLIINDYTQFINPFIYLFACMLVIKTGLFFSKKLNLESLYATVMGLR